MNDRQQVEQGKVIKFGIAQIVNATPLWMKYILRGALFLQGLWALIPYDMVNLSELQYGKVTRWLALINAIIFFAIKFFGWELPDKQTDNNPLP